MASRSEGSLRSAGPSFTFWQFWAAFDAGLIDP